VAGAARGIYGKTSTLGDFLVAVYSIDVQINKNAAAKQENWPGRPRLFLGAFLTGPISLSLGVCWKTREKLRAAPSAAGIYYYLISFLTMSAENVATGFICGTVCGEKIRQ
jgi:hypothetical protein